MTIYEGWIVLSAIIIFGWFIVAVGMKIADWISDCIDEQNS